MERADGGSKTNKKRCKLLYNFFLQGGQGRFRFLPLGPPAPPVTPLKRSLREGVRHCTPSLHCTKRLPFTGSWQTEGLTEGLTITSEKTFFFNPSGFRYAKPTTLVGIWSSCSAAACNTPYSARFSPRCIAHWARSARIPFQGRLNVEQPKSCPHLRGKCRGVSRDERGTSRGSWQLRVIPLSAIHIRSCPRTLVGIWSSCSAVATYVPRYTS